MSNTMPVHIYIWEDERAFNSKVDDPVYQEQWDPKGSPIPDVGDVITVFASMKEQFAMYHGRVKSRHWIMRSGDGFIRVDCEREL